MSNCDKYSRRNDTKYEHRDNGEGRHRESKYDDPPHSRLFIVCGKSINEDDFKTHFSKYGTIEEVWMVKDRNTDEPKGVTYIKFSKTSEAALAMEEMNGRCIGTHPRPLKVLIAHSREQGSRRDMNEEERLLRLFVVVPKTMSECDLREHFADYGDIDYVSVVKDRMTKESKGFAYVKYHRMSHTARAFENCDRSFKPVFADPKPQKDSKDIPYRSGSEVREERQPSCFSVETGAAENSSRLTVIASPTLNQDQLWKLFDLVPGLDYCDLRKDRKIGQTRGVATVVYSTVQAATYAREKLHGFEYPPGQRLIVKMDQSNDINHHNAISNGSLSFSTMSRGLNANQNGAGTNSMGLGLVTQSLPVNNVRQNIQQDLATQLAETIAQATSLIQAAGLSQGTNNNVMQSSTPANGTESYDPFYCNVRLPPPQPLAPVDSPVAERLFIVCNPSPPPIYALKDVFGRFGNLIDIYILSGKTFGYAKYAHKDSANKAIMALHCQEVMGARLKVMEADPQEKSESSRKRIRVDDQN